MKMVAKFRKCTQLINSDTFPKLFVAIKILLCFFVTLTSCEHVNRCNASGIIEKFPHCIGYWPSNYNPTIIDTSNSDIYTDTMSATVEDLKQLSIEQKHTIQVSILLPYAFRKQRASFLGSVELKKALEKLAPAQKRSGIGTLIGFNTIREKKLIRDDILFNITLRDSKCDETYGLKAFLDAFSEDVHVIFGPSCDYSLGKQI